VRAGGCQERDRSGGGTVLTGVPAAITVYAMLDHPPPYLDAFGFVVVSRIEGQYAPCLRVTL
jgi:hypothetical protein